MTGRRRAFVLFLTTFSVLGAAVIAVAASQSGGSPDLPPFAQSSDPDANANYLKLRDEAVARLRGIEPDHFFDPAWRTQAVAERFRQERAAKSSTVWTEIGPDTVPNGQSLQYPTPPDPAVSGRVSAIAVDPTNANRAYLGAAQGGVWRTLDGGTTWTQIFDTASSLSIGALALAPSDPTKLYVGTGEANNSCDSFFGVGVYRIDNVTTSANLVGPINPAMSFTASGGGTINTTAFGGRGISKILVDPTNAANIFVSTGTGIGGISCNALSNTVGPLGLRSVYRSTNATLAAGSVTFTKLAVTTDNSLDNPPTGNTSISDMALVNNDPNTLLVAASGTTLSGGVFRSTNALTTATFTQTLTPGFTGLWHRLAVSGNTVLATSNESSGLLRESTDGGQTWPTTLTAANGFCDGQCSYDNPVAIDPNTSGSTLRIFIGGAAGASTNAGLKVSNDNGTSFSVDQTGLHADFHAIAVDSTTNPSTVWVGNDGGVWKRAANAAAGTAWTDMNNSLGTLQFQSIAVGKSDAFFTLGGTQDNGTEIEQTSLGNWSNADFGDGGYALIDQSTTSTSSVTMYHTYFNQRNNLIGFARTNLTSCATKGNWAVRGFIGGGSSCDGSAASASNGISGADNVLFYAPMALGPGTPSTLYFGTSRLYRSTDRGDTMTVVSQGPIDDTGGATNATGSPVSAIGISPQDDNYRIVGLQNGQVWATTTGASPLTKMTGLTAPANATGSTTNKFVGRAVIDPTNKNTAYVTFDYYTNPSNAGQVWKTTNLNNATPTWTVASNGIPNVPVNAFAVDPNNATHLFAGTDIGVYASTDGGANWAPLGTGLPAVAVFDMAIVQPGTSTEKLRIATHGRSMWQIDLTSTPTSVSVASFTTRRVGSAVRVSWRTVSEAQIAGFNLYRNGVKLNSKLVVAKRAGQARGASYSFVDTRPVRGAHYRLQIVSRSGARSWYRR